MKNEIDWSRAPEGATHWCDESDTDYACWLRRNEDGSWSGMLPSHGAWEVAFVDADTMRTTTPRPAAWNGEGLPPVGTVCEYFDNKGEWYPAVMSHIGSHLFIVKYQHPEHGQQEACMHIASNDGPISSRLRPIRTPEQIAAEEREKAIEQMVQFFMNYYGNPKGAEQYLLICRSLHDHGYRKTEGGAQ